MANDILGSELNIDGLIEAADKAQKAMDEVADSAEGAGKKISDVFKSISTQGIDYTLQKLYDLKATYESISKVEVKDAGLKEIATNAKTALDEVNKLIEGLSKAYGANAPTSTTAQQKAEENRYNEWLRQKHEEEQIHKQIEDRKTQATRSAIAEQNQAYADANAKKQSIARDNDNVKINSEVARKAYEEQLRMYENLFAQAEKKRPDLIDVAKTRTDINAIDSQLDKLMDRINRLNNEMQLFKSMESGKTLKTEDYAHIGKVSDELNKLMAQYEALDKLKIAMSSKSGFEQAISDLSGVSLQAQRSKQALDDLAQSYRTGTSAFHQQMKTPEFALDFSKNAKTIEEERQAIQLLKQARESLDRTTPDGKKKVQELTDAIANHEKNLKRATQSTQEYNEAQRKLASKRLEHIYSVSPNLALNYSQQAKSINEQILAIKRLKSARDNLNRGNFASEEAYRKKIEQLNDEIKRQQKEVDKLTNKNKNLSNSHRSLMDTAGQLQRKLALLFSVSAIQGYINKLITVRGEFELQAKSLEVLLQNKDEANRLWNQTVQLAVKSPFTVKELVSYTKQLAAYRIESEKLFETNKMLADVSAGLGVDMGRLILAFGQVKAANFLRGTELRQFSEAGVNMLGELAKYFTELEGRAVSVGDVFERISKRMVTFADVETVFKRITSAGGTFYQMQENQAETTRGMISNLKDSIDIMLNDIGQAHDGTIKNMLDLVRTLVENWRMLAPILTNVSFTLAAVYATKGIGTLITNIKDAHKAFRLLQRTIKNTGFALKNLNRIPMGGWMALIGVLASVGMAIYQVATATDELTEELTRLNSEGEKEMYKMIAKYKELADASQDVTKSEEERKQALKDLEHTFKNILPMELRREEYIKGLAGHYDEATRAMRQHYNESIALQKKEAIESYYVKEIVKNTADLKNDFFDLIVKAKENGAISDKLANNLKLGFEGAISKTIADIKSGKITSDRESLLDSLYENLFNYAEVPRAQREQLRNELMKYIDVLDLVKNFIKLGNLGQAKLNIWEVLGVDKNAYELAGNISDLNDQMLGVTGIFDETATDRVLREQTERVKESVDVIFNEYEKLEKIGQASIGKDEKAIDDAFKIDFNKAIENIRKNAPQYEQAFIDAISKLKKASATNTIEFGAIIPDIRDSLNKEVANILKSYNSHVASMPVIAPLIDFDLKTFDSQLSSASNSIETLNGAILDTKTQAEITNTAVQSYAQTLEKSFDDKKLSTSQKAIVELFRFAVDKYGGSMEDLKKFNVTASTSTGQMANDVNNYLELVTESINNYNKGLQNLTNAGKDYEEAVQIMVNSTGKSAEDIKRLETVVKPILQLIVAVLNPALLKKGNKSGADPFSKQLDVVRKLNTEYKSLLKTFKKTESATILVEKLGDAFEEAFGRKLTIDDVQKEGFITNLYDELNQKAKNKKQKIQVKLAKGEDEIEVRIKEKENETKRFIDDIQKKIDKYELSVELDKIGIPKDIAKSLFGIEATDLADIKKELENQISNLQKAGGSEDRIKDLQAEYDKIIEMENKQLEEIAKNYLKYLKKSNAEAVNIVLDGERQKQQIQKAYDKRVKEAKEEEDKKAWKEWKEAAEKGVDKDTTQKLQQQIWKDIQSGPLYKMIYEDPERFSYNMIDRLITSLQDLKKNTTDVELLHAIQDEMDKLYSLKFQKNPFKAVKDGLQEIKKWENSLKSNVTKAFDEIGVFNFSHKVLKGTQGVKDLQNQIKDLESLAEVIATIDSEIKKVGGMLLTEKDNTDLQKYYDTLLKVKAALSGIADSAPKSLPKTFEEGAKGVMAYAQAIGSIASAMDGLLAQLGVAEDSSARVWLQNVQMVTSVITAVATLSLALIALQATMGPIGWIALAVAGIAATVASIFGSDDKKKQKEIENLERQVRKLESAYKDLEKAIESAYSVETLKGDYEESIDNINKRITSTYKMIDAERDKKDTDQGRIDEWLEQIKELEREKKELQEEIVTGLGGSYDIRNTTREFVEAWIEAFNETGNGLHGLEENFKEFFKNILIEQAIMKGASTLMKPLLDEINASLEDDYKVSTVEMEKILSTSNVVFDRVNEYLSEMFGEGSPLTDWISDSADNLTGLQRGIQGITESQADIIAAYLNSMRAYVADNNLKLTQMLDAWTNTDVENPMVAQLKIQTELIRSIKDMFSGVIRSGHPTYGGSFIKVAL